MKLLEKVRKFMYERYGIDDLNMKEKIKRPFEVIIKNRKDKEHIYKKCRKCKTILKLPLPAKRGMKIAKCPKCQNRISFYAFKYQKIEIIKDKKSIKI